jgi:hypothetical protein
MVALSLAAFLLSATSELVVYHCNNAADQTRFALTYERRGRKLRNVTIGYFGLPRVGRDVRTSWTGGLEADGGATFRMIERGRGSYVRGDMRLSPVQGRSGVFRLSWSSIIGGGHTPIEDPERFAECNLQDFGRADPAS